MIVGLRLKNLTFISIKIYTVGAAVNPAVNCVIIVPAVPDVV